MKWFFILASLAQVLCFGLTVRTPGGRLTQVATKTNKFGVVKSLAADGRVKQVVTIQRPFVIRRTKTTDTITTITKGGGARPTQTQIGASTGFTSRPSSAFAPPPPLIRRRRPPPAPSKPLQSRKTDEIRPNSRIRRPPQGDYTAAPRRPTRPMGGQDNVTTAVTRTMKFDLSKFPVDNCSDGTYCNNNEGLCKCDDQKCYCVPLSEFPPEIPLPPKPVIPESPVIPEPQGMPSTQSEANFDSDGETPPNSVGPEMGGAPGVGGVGGDNLNQVVTAGSPMLPNAPPPPPEIVYEGGESEGAGSGGGPWAGLSDPQNPNVNWCWKMTRPVSSVKNWGHLVSYAECRNARDSDTLHEARINVVCTDTGGIEVTHNPMDEKFPYKIGCISREDAVKSESESCWKMTGSTVRQMTLTRVAGGLGKDTCSQFNLQKPFQDGVHISSRFGSAEGGIPTLYHCNGGTYTEAIIPYRLIDGKFGGYDTTICQPYSSQAAVQCRGLGSQCLHNLDEGRIA